MSVGRWMLSVVHQRGVVLHFSFQFSRFKRIARLSRINAFELNAGIL